MADKDRKVDRNVPGRWYVDANCIACGLCVEVAPENLELDWDAGFAFLKSQPREEKQEAAMRDAASQCPVEAIGSDG
ncbi:MAG: ferredoxin [Deltaproteobacteria bacterium]|nr:ferredoxin [Deltaproteobacteria bacterium]